MVVVYIHMSPQYVQLYFHCFTPFYALFLCEWFFHPLDCSIETDTHTRSTIGFNIIFFWTTFFSSIPFRFSLSHSLLFSTCVLYTVSPPPHITESYRAETAFLSFSSLIYLSRQEGSEWKEVIVVTLLILMSRLIDTKQWIYTKAFVVLYSYSNTPVWLSVAVNILSGNNEKVTLLDTIWFTNVRQ